MVTSTSQSRGARNMARAGMLKVVPLEELPGDPELTRDRVSQWSAGQKVCRTRGRHHWRKDRDRVYGTDANRPGTRVTRVQVCPDCKNKREADHVVVSLGKASRGLRRVEDWHTIYVEVKGVPYLLDKGSQRITDDLREEMVAEEFFADTTKRIYVDESED